MKKKRCSLPPAGLLTPLQTDRWLTYRVWFKNRWYH